MLRDPKVLIAIALFVFGLGQWFAAGGVELSATVLVLWAASGALAAWALVAHVVALPEQRPVVFPARFGGGQLGGESLFLRATGEYAHGVSIDPANLRGGFTMKVLSGPRQISPDDTHEAEYITDVTDGRISTNLSSLWMESKFYGTPDEEAEGHGRFRLVVRYADSMGRKYISHVLIERDVLVRDSGWAVDLEKQEKDGVMATLKRRLKIR